jgi:hypothetical protein
VERRRSICARKVTARTPHTDSRPTHAPADTQEALYRYLGFKSDAYLEDDIRGIHTTWWAMKTDLPVPAPPN